MKTKKQPQTEISALNIALLEAKRQSDKFRNIDDGGTCNLDLPVLMLPGWNKEDIKEAFKNTGLLPSIEGTAVYVLGGTQSCGFRRTAIAEAMRDSLKQSGYNAFVYYRID